MKWKPISSAPRNKRILLWVPPYEGLPAFQTVAQYSPEYGWAVDELREPTKWRYLPEDPE
jgi:hypothetical protein